MSNMLRASCAVMVFSGTLACAGAGGAQRPAAPVPYLTDPAAGIELVFVKGGCYPMGTATGAPGGPEEKPAHEVCVDDFYIGKYEVTQGQWAAAMGSNPSHHANCGSGCPVETVSWNDAQSFIAKLNARSAGAGALPGQYRLPTEAEWEYAARSGGRAERFSGGSDDLGSVAWYLLVSPVPHPVGTKAPNGLGIYDMTGNVWEWTSDWYGSTYYSVSPRDNPSGPAAGDRRVLRGGSFGNEWFDVRTSFRNFLPPDYRGASKGLRVAMSAPMQGR